MIDAFHQLGTNCTIHLLPLGKIEENVLHTLSSRVRETFGCVTDVLEPKELPQVAYNSQHSQYSSSRILSEMRKMVIPLRNEKILAIVDVDLYVPGLNFVFGEAELGGSFSIISLTRLRQAYYGFEENETLFLERAAKEATHELGHNFRLRHCPRPECVMRFSNSLADTDRKKDSFCMNCLRLLRKSLSSP